MNKDSIESALRISIIAYLFLVFSLTIYGGWQGYVTNNGWKIGDWLINYHGGFVRRGFLGEFILQFSSLTDISPGFYVFLLQLFFYFCFFVFCFLLLRQQQSLIPYIMLIFSPFIFTFQVHDFQGGYRKEIIYFAILTFTAWSALSHKVKIFEINFLLVLLVYPMFILSHEMLAIFLPYIVVIYILKVDVNKKKLAVITLLISLSVLSFMLSIVNRGNEEQVVAIFNSLGNYAPTGGAISWLTKPASFGLNLVLKRISTYHYLEYYTFAIILSFIAFIPILNKLKKLFNNRLTLSLVLISFIGSISLFTVAIDWGRFIYIHLISLFTLSLLVNDFIPLSESKTYIKSLSINKFMNLNVKMKKSLILVIVVLMIGYSSLWHIPHCGGQPFISSTTYKIKNIIFAFF